MRLHLCSSIAGHPFRGSDDLSVTARIFRSFPQVCWDGKRNRAITFTVYLYSMKHPPDHPASWHHTRCLALCAGVEHATVVACKKSTTGLAARLHLWRKPRLTCLAGARFCFARLKFYGSAKGRWSKGHLPVLPWVPGLPTPSSLPPMLGSMCGGDSSSHPRKSS